MDFGSIFIMWAFGLVCGVFPMIAYFELVFRLKASSGATINNYFFHGLASGLVMSISIVVASMFFLADETKFTFLSLSPYMIVGFETTAYWVSQFYSRRGRSIKGMLKRRKEESKG